MERTIAHPIFHQKLINLRSVILAKTANNFLSLGGISYYIYDEIFSTRIVLFNYVSHYANSNFSSDWEIKLYASSGDQIFSKKGTFSGQELAILDLKDVKPASKYGVVVAHIKPNNGGQIMRKAFDSVFFTEHYNRDNLCHDVAHSLRWPTPVKYVYNITGHGFSFLSEAKPYLLIANSYHTKFRDKSVLCHPILELTNHEGEVKRVKTDPILPMGCQRADLLELVPDLKEHFGGLPGMIKVIGANIMRKPFFYQTDGKYISSDHL